MGSQKDYKVIYINPEDKEPKIYNGEFTDRKSRFIASIRKVDREEEVFWFLEEIRSKYKEACSHAYAYVIGQNGELFRCNDNGEPSGTAGKPMLDVIQGAGIRGIVAVVSRYYGGTKLGTGGLIRAYTNTVKEALKTCPIATMKFARRILVETDYNGIGKILYFMEQESIQPESTEYMDKVFVKVLLTEEAAQHFIREVTELTAGRSKITVMEEGMFPMLETDKE